MGAAWVCGAEDDVFGSAIGVRGRGGGTPLRLDWMWPPWDSVLKTESHGDTNIRIRIGPDSWANKLVVCPEIPRGPRARPWGYRKQPKVQ